MKNITPLQPGSVGPTLGPLKPGVYGLCSKAELSRGHSGLWLGEHKPRKATQSRSTALPLALQSRRHVQHDNPTDQPALLRLWNSPGHKTGVGSPSLLQGIFPIQGSDPGLPQGRGTLQLSHQGSPLLLHKGTKFSCSVLSNSATPSTAARQASDHHLKLRSLEQGLYAGILPQERQLVMDREA